MWDLPGPGLQPMSPALAGGFFTTVPPGKPTLATFIQHNFGSPSHSNQTRKREERHPIGKERLKLLLFTDDMILYIGNPKDTTKKLLELINELAAGYKISTQNYVVFI